MSKINEMNLLLIKRDLLIENQKAELDALKLQFDETRKIITPANIIKCAFIGNDFKTNLINIALGFATNYIIDIFPSLSNKNNFQKIINRLFKFMK